ncbi:MAG: hypothetical protein HC769_10250 [Cyanobacteria bacterium CRU_2_1]|nr:hypothetical protein [Cyanobacteria bacterium CRU_2_1]
MIFDQSEFDIRCEWGKPGIEQLAPVSRVIVIVDVLSFSTCVEVATRQGAIVFPYQWKDESAADYAKSMNAELVSLKRSVDRPSLSPTSLRSLAPGTRLVLPSQNGAVLSLQTGQTPTIAGSLRNNNAVAQYIQPYKTGISVIPAGEQWQDNSLRPALEDVIGAGAILSYLKGTRSPEAEMAVAVFDRFKHHLTTTLKQCSSGKELIAKGFETDVELAATLNMSHCIPRLVNNAYVNVETSDLL